MVTNETIKQGIEAYTEHSVTKLERFDDPNVPGAIALRATLDYGGEVEFLIPGGRPEPRTPRDVVEALAEVEYPTWPPTAGERLHFL